MRSLFIIPCIVSVFRICAFELFSLEEAQKSVEFTEPLGENAQPVAVVKTYADLLKQPQIKIDKTHTARLGISSTSAPVGSGILVYAICEPYDAELFLNMDESDEVTQLGPFKVEGEWGEESMKQIQEVLKQIKRLPETDGPFLFLQSVPVQSKKGKLNIFLGQHAEPLISIPLEGTSEPHHAWLPFTTPNLLQDAVEATEDSSFLVETEVDPSMAAIPKFSNDHPHKLPCNLPEDPLAQLPLPGLWQELPPPVTPPGTPLTAEESKKIDNEVTALSSDDYELRCTSEKLLLSRLQTNPAVRKELGRHAQEASDLESYHRIKRVMRAYEPNAMVSWNEEKRCLEIRFEKEVSPDFDFHEKFLARWWVNGKEVAPNANHFEKMIQKDGGMQMSKVKRVDLSMEFGFDTQIAMGAKPGDKIEVQVMYCPDGHKPAGILEHIQKQLEAMKEEENQERSLPIVSNRISFEMPAPPPEPEQVQQAAQSDDDEN